MIRKLLLSLISGLPAQAATPATPPVDARGWIAAAAGHEGAYWQQDRRLELPSGAIFIGDPSWGDDYHLGGAQPVPAPALDVWLLISADQGRVHAVWLEAAGTLPARISAELDFGMDSAYFALGDLTTGQDLAELRNRDIEGAPDSFEFFLPHIQQDGFTALWLDVPPDGRPVLAINAGNDGSRRAVWISDAEGGFSGILIDVTGRAGDHRFIDLEIGAQPAAP
ncbi:MAG: hypothetical protein Q4G25_13650 [Paracoccus sp. (in: a-proteobacteria)]|nr:hypothetical protein [Paracoccus sp. (in: a-proteobacteria)]